MESVKESRRAVIESLNATLSEFTGESFRQNKESLKDSAKETVVALQPIIDDFHADFKNVVMVMSMPGVQAFFMGMALGVEAGIKALEAQKMDKQFAT